ncbi:transmembrane protein (macronuclear) [Tetrahymena thermophila SB210]|uniref:Transmembrane protein n=1 Tax=Tetrahymena thermophila (strain SB210) TaxID=312017 RepID=Q246A7_TETTS|nr:transmembrane protein [Tetrahymena thermophila SB210]EAS03476.2 transmembrane protein [Tetrahymena thermophila SB210]|eukprot:XP_001023721.2 transmembrane protein [Tetrahymena thermophila SB210]
MYPQIRNTALSSGGALYFENIGSTLILFDSQTQVINNKALIGGGLRIVSTNSSGLTIPLSFPFEKNVYQNNAIIYGDNSATYLQKIFIQNSNSQTTTENNYTFKFLDDLNIIPQEYQSQYQSLVDIGQFQSGGSLKLSFQITDNYNRCLSFDLQTLLQNRYPKDIQDELKSIQITINNLNSNKTELLGERILNYNQYNSNSFSFELTELQIQGVLQSKQFLSIDSSIYENSQVELPILLSIYFRQCLVGEIIEQQVNQIVVCKFCSYGTYSLVNPSILFQQSQNIKSGVKNECKNCPTSATACQGSTIQLKNGYWKQNNSTDEIIECNPQIMSCQAESPSSINICKIGYFGPICQECDNLGEVWKGLRYSETSNKGECQECYSLSFQWIYLILKINGMIAYFGKQVGIQAWEQIAWLNILFFKKLNMQINWQSIIKSV